MTRTMDRVTTFNDRLKDYCTHKVASMRLAARIRAYWNEQGIHPILKIDEGLGPDGKPLFSIRGNLRFNFSKDTVEIVPLCEFENKKEKA